MGRKGKRSMKEGSYVENLRVSDVRGVSNVGETPPVNQGRCFESMEKSFSGLVIGESVPNPAKMQIVVKSAHYIPDPWDVPKKERSDDYRYFARLTVEPTLTVAALKSMLKSYQWAMVENLVIVSEDGTLQLQDDNFTLGDYGVKENDTLLVCGEDGPFRLYIYSIMDMQGFSVSVRGCFSNIWDVKQKIFKIIGYKPEVQVLIHCAKSARLEDNTLLVALVKPYMEDMESEMKWKVPYLQLVGPVRKRRNMETARN